ncbi:hypothetical protein KUDE01_017279, partial [Dissostichus eleginoides]
NPNITWTPSVAFPTVFITGMPGGSQAPPSACCVSGSLSPKNKARARENVFAIVAPPPVKDKASGNWQARGSGGLSRKDRYPVVALPLCESFISAKLFITALSGLLALCDLRSGSTQDHFNTP